MSNTIPAADRNDTTSFPRPATYTFANERTEVLLWGLTHRGEPVVSFPNGDVRVVATHRVRLVPRERLP